MEDKMLSGEVGNDAPEKAKKRRVSRFSEAIANGQTTSHHESDSITQPSGAGPDKTALLSVPVNMLQVRSSVLQSRIQEALAHGASSSVQSERLSESPPSDLIKPNPSDPSETTDVPRKRKSRFSSSNEEPSHSSAIPEPFSASSAPVTTSLQSAGDIDLDSIPVGPVTTFKVNKNRMREQKLKEILELDIKEEGHQVDRDNPFFDPEIRGGKGKQRVLGKGVAFVQPGTLIEKAKELRVKREQEHAKEEIKAKLLDQENSIPVFGLLKDERRFPPPVVEWWDAPFLNADTYPEPWLLDAGNLSIAALEVRFDVITSYIHHPSKVEINPQLAENVQMRLMLTKVEMKKMRRQRRALEQTEKRERIQMGLEPPPPPKVKLSNLMRVLAVEQSMNPTKVEAAVRAQVEERQRRHELQNEARKLTKEEKRQKILEKVEKDRSKGTYAAVFRIQDMSNGKHRYKVNINADHYHLSGALILFEECNCVVVEGGPHAIRQFTHLMLRRIDWSIKDSKPPTVSVAEADKGLDEGDLDHDLGVKWDAKDVGAMTSPSGDGRPTGAIAKRPLALSSENSCVQVWYGLIETPLFLDFKVFTMTSYDDVRSFFKRHYAVHYWDSCWNHVTS